MSVGSYIAALLASEKLGGQVTCHRLLPAADLTADLATILAQKPAVQRAMVFGSEQLLAQQRGLWQVIAARHNALLAE